MVSNRPLSSRVPVFLSCTLFQLHNLETHLLPRSHHKGSSLSTSWSMVGNISTQSQLYLKLKDILKDFSVIPIIYLSSSNQLSDLLLTICPLMCSYSSVPWQHPQSISSTVLHSALQVSGPHTAHLATTALTPC